MHLASASVFERTVEVNEHFIGFQLLPVERAPIAHFCKNGVYNFGPRPSCKSGDYALDVSLAVFREEARKLSGHWRLVMLQVS